MRFIFLALALVLFFTWVGAFVVFHLGAAFIHLFLFACDRFLGYPSSQWAPACVNSQVITQA